ncbi:serine hydrolase domain-containing protein [Sphingomicrobium arenosum]|uniref:serine hydrolase domain-containing protein n=1 Tax=Sphingomicrobium arenosum TaxID=2233861 RepID=UPI002240F57F|nr:serine hydrolase [Sphingomicrobium arenosum]
METIVTALAALALSACIPTTAPRANSAPTAALPSPQQLDAIIAAHDPQALAIGVLRGGKLVFEHYDGIEAPGQPVDARSRFEIASITKTIAAETFLRMVAVGDADLDTPIANWWVDPDVADDPRARLLTPRHILTHQSGWDNWRFFRADGTLTFNADPGTRYGYSGEGFNALFRAMEKKSGKTYAELLDRYLLAPLGITEALATFEAEPGPHMVQNRTEDGDWLRPACRPGFCWPAGTWSAAGGMKISLPDYTKILAAIAEGSGYPAALKAERDAIITDQGGDSVVDCTLAPAACPEAQGYGLGMVRIDDDGHSLIGHGGYDWNQLTLAYADQKGDGLVIFLAGPPEPNLALMRDLVAAIDPGSPYVVSYGQWHDRASASD